MSLQLIQFLQQSTYSDGTFIVKEAGQLECWFDFGSTYSYPAVMRLEELTNKHHISIHWRPFLLGAIFNDQGLNDSPFNLVPNKGQYMWRDLERICDEINLPWQRPSVFPRNGLLAARIVSMFEDEEWIADFIKLVFRENFEFDRDISATSIIENCLNNLKLDTHNIIEKAVSQTSKDKLFKQTSEAKQKGIFGAPMIVVGEELFWGNDRLESAVNWLISSR